MLSREVQGVKANPGILSTCARARISFAKTGCTGCTTLHPRFIAVRSGCQRRARAPFQLIEVVQQRRPVGAASGADGATSSDGDCAAAVDDQQTGVDSKPLEARRCPTSEYSVGRSESLGRRVSPGRSFEIANVNGQKRPARQS
jgi:hypothetical protein